jgi:phosphoribosylglycinamide formyltransferase-1
MSASDNQRRLPLPFVVLASGAGTNCAVLLEHAKRHPELLTAKAVISDRSGAPALDVAAKMGVETFVVGHREEGPMLALLRKLGPRWACLAGYKRLVGKGFLDYFGDEGFSRVLNVHPSLLPAYPGLNGYERAFSDGVKVSGVTVHLVDSGLDTGLPVLQESFPRLEGDRLEDFISRGREIEHRLFPRALELAASGNLKLKTQNGMRWISAEGTAP